MIVYLAHAKANYASEGDGYVMALRGAEHPKTLYSFHYINGTSLPIHENLPRLQHGQELDEHGLRAQPASS